MRWRPWLAAFCLALPVTDCGGAAATQAPTMAPRTATPLAAATAGMPGVPLLAVGDVGDCGSAGDEAVAALAAALPGDILLLGDIAYENGTADDFGRCFDPAWAPLKPRLHPAPGNHDYNTGGAAPYFAYFGTAAGEPGKGYYSFDVGGWHVVALNSNCAALAGGCGEGSAMLAWLQGDLASHRAACTLAFWHHPRFTSGLHGATVAMQPAWAALAASGAELVISGHDHHYERFAPLDARGAPDDTFGLRQFVVGTGGATLVPTFRTAAHSEAKDVATYGLLRLELLPGAYRWEFVPASPAGYRDSGEGLCHGAPGP